MFSEEVALAIWAEIKKDLPRPKKQEWLASPDIPGTCYLRLALEFLWVDISENCVVILFDGHRRCIELANPAVFDAIYDTIVRWTIMARGIAESFEDIAGIYEAARNRSLPCELFKLLEV